MCSKKRSASLANAGDKETSRGAGRPLKRKRPRSDIEEVVGASMAEQKQEGQPSGAVAPAKAAAVVKAVRVNPARRSASSRAVAEKSMGTEVMKKTAAASTEAPVLTEAPMTRARWSSSALLACTSAEQSEASPGAEQPGPGSSTPVPFGVSDFFRLT